MLSVFEAGRLILRLSGGWLYPLFALHFAADAGRRSLFAASDLVSCEDTKIGQGAVFLYTALGISSAGGMLVSRLAANKARHFGIGLSAAEWTASIQCRTEELLAPVDELSRGIELLEARIKDEFRRAPGEFVEILEMDREHPVSRVAAILEA